jgi:hypothetical protein
MKSRTCGKITAPAPAGEDAVVADPGRNEMRAPLARDVEAQRMRRLGLPVARNIVELALDGEERGLADGTGPHQLLAHEHAPLGQRELLEHGLHRIQVVLGGQVEHGVVLVVEAPMRLGRLAIADHQVVEVFPVRIDVAIGVHRYEAQVLEKSRIHAPHVARILRRHALDDVALEP